MGTVYRCGGRGEKELGCYCTTYMTDRHTHIHGQQNNAQTHFFKMTIMYETFLKNKK